MENEESIVVWDLLVRVFHWALVIFFIVAYFSGDDDNTWHIYSGYIVLGLVVFRIIWGVIGTRYARFSNFIYSPRKVINYAKSLIQGQPEHYVGHNPAGGYLIIALLLSLLVVTLSGLKLYALEEGRGLFAGNAAKNSAEVSLVQKTLISQSDNENAEEEEDEEEGEEFWEELHEAASNFTVFLIFIHITGVLISSRLEKQNLVKAMFTGRKKSG